MCHQRQSRSPGYRLSPISGAKTTRLFVYEARALDARIALVIYKLFALTIMGTRAFQTRGAVIATHRVGYKRRGR
jgi:hypothetical protein